MSFYTPEPPYTHGTLPKVGILLANLGTPDAPTPSAVRRYLKQFLSDRRVVEIPRFIWWCILNLIILNVRPRKSAAKYALIWTAQGSPLLVHTQAQVKALQGELANRIQSPFAVECGMSYGNPSIASAMAKLKAQNCTKILVMPMYPQYAASSTASAFDAVWNTLLHSRNMPEIRTVRSYHDHPSYIAALAESVRQHWAANGQPEKLLMSFHGVPKYTLVKGDPYHCLCQKTGRLLAEKLGLSKEQYLVTFQSRFGAAEWLQPYTAPTLAAWGKAGIKKVDVICPGFAADCLETLEEIAMECKAEFLNAGGTVFNYIPALNERQEWIAALADIAGDHLQGWVSAEWDASAAQLEANKSRELAIAMGSAT
ncbi:MAG: ferrochelatase [Methylophilales bacterium]|nr:ferrochelatase [Methylophilales bacterium]